MKKSESLEEAAERIYQEWDEALSDNNIERLLSLYTVDCTLESPLIPYLLKTKQGICHGSKELRQLLELVALRKPEKRKYYRVKYFTDGKTLMFEYPRLTPNGEQMDFVEVMELKNGLIHYHRVYWGWYGFNVINQDEYYRKT